LGKRFGKGTQPVAAAIAAADPAELSGSLRSGQPTTVLVDGTPVILDSDDVVVTETPREGWAVESAAGETLALDLEVTDALRRAGLAREVVRQVQDARKNAGLQVSDRIALWWRTDSVELAAALREHGDQIAHEVLATTHTEGTPDDPATIATVNQDLALTFWLRRSYPSP
jgi:isoleucyl-tRNA synthetase